MYSRAETSFHPKTHTCWWTQQHDGKQGLKAGRCVPELCLYVCKKKDVHWRRPAKSNHLSKRLVIHWNGLSVFLSIQEVLPVSALHSIIASRKPYHCCNPTSNQTAVIPCHSPTILYRISTAGWEDEALDGRVGQILIEKNGLWTWLTSRQESNINSFHSLGTPS